MSILEQFISEQQQQQSPFNDGPPQPGGGPGPAFGNPNFRGGQPVRFRPPGPFDNSNGGPPRGGFRGPAPFGGGHDQQRPPFQDNHRPAPFGDGPGPQHFNERHPSPFWDPDRSGGPGGPPGGPPGGRDFHNRGPPRGGPGG